MHSSCMMIFQNKLWRIDSSLYYYVVLLDVKHILEMYSIYIHDCLNVLLK